MDAAVFDNHGSDTRFTGPIDVAPTISATYGTGGNNQPFVVGDTHLKLLKSDVAVRAVAKVLLSRIINRQHYPAIMTRRCLSQKLMVSALKTAMP
jgi:hypothetical protein